MVAIVLVILLPFLVEEFKSFQHVPFLVVLPPIFNKGDDSIRHGQGVIMRVFDYACINVKDLVLLWQLPVVTRNMPGDVQRQKRTMLVMVESLCASM